MAINKKLIHFKKHDDFIGSNGINGATLPTENEEGINCYGNIPEWAIVFIQDEKQIWTHGTFYNCNSPELPKYFTKEELDEILTEYAKLEDIPAVTTDGDGTKFLSDDGTYKEAGAASVPTKLSELENDVPYMVDLNIPGGVNVMDASGNIMAPEDWTEDLGLTGLVVNDGTYKLVMAVGDSLYDGEIDDLSITSLKKLSETLLATSVPGIISVTDNQTSDFASKNNTDALLEALTNSDNPDETSNGAVVARNHSAGIYGKGEWDLPSCGHALVLVNYRTRILEVLTAINRSDWATIFINKGLWSSTEYNGDSKGWFYSMTRSTWRAEPRELAHPIVPIHVLEGISVPTKTSQLENDSNYISYSKKTVTSLSNVPTTSNLVIANISSSQSFTLANIPIAGKEIHIIVYNDQSSDAVITLPNYNPYIAMNTDALAIPAYGYGEINTISDGTNIYIRAI